MRISDWSSDVCSSDLLGECISVRFACAVDLVNSLNRVLIFVCYVLCVQALVIDGKALTYIVGQTEDAKLIQLAPSDDFMRFADLCRSVVVCRSAPLQKALVVELVRTFHPATITLDRKSTRLNSSHSCASPMPSSA